MHFQRLRLSGFKSFVDATELRIEPGVTGIVGPNGCGKSNLLEALRWVMGANSAKAMRAGGMDDVIFSGSGNRPARNTAEVGLVLDNSARTAPAAFNDSEILEVTRRIEREAGSTYRVNGKEVRARAEGATLVLSVRSASLAVWSKKSFSSNCFSTLGKSSTTVPPSPIKNPANTSATSHRPR